MGCHACELEVYEFRARSSTPLLCLLKSGSTVLVSAFDAGLGYFWRQLVESGRVFQRTTRDVDLVEQGWRERGDPKLGERGTKLFKRI